MKILRPVILLSLSTFLISLPVVLFAKNDGNILNSDRSRETFLDGYIQSEFDDHQLAIEYYTESIRLNPNNFFAYFNRAYSRNKINDIAGAWDDLNRALEIDPTNGIASYNRAIVNWKLGHQLSSIKDYTKAINKDIALKNSYAIRGILKSNIGDAKGACSDWKEASENKNERATLWFKQNCIPNISEEFQKKTENKVLIANARRKYFDGEIEEGCNYYALAKKNGYKATTLRNKLKLKFITDPICFFF